jgi:Replication-relaxation
MRTPVAIRKAWEKIIIALAEFDYLTAAQITRLLYSPSSLKHVQEQMKLLVDADYVLTLGGRTVNLPLIYTLSSTGRNVASILGAATGKRVRPSEEADKGRNPYFLKHLMAVTDVLIGAQRLSQTHPVITLSRLITERQLKRKIHVEIPAKISEKGTRFRTICVEPDAGVQFTITETWHETPQIWEDFFFIEVYRNLPPAKWRFKQKIAGYVSYAVSGWHEQFFRTPVLSIAVIAQTDPMATTLKRWTEQELTQLQRPEEGEWFFFCSCDPATASPEDLFLSPIWEHPFDADKTPLIVLE